MACLTFSSGSMSTMRVSTISYLHRWPSIAHSAKTNCSNRRQEVQWAGVCDENHPKRSFVRLFVHSSKTDTQTNRHHVCFYI
jgi:hypothetical protein